MPVCVSFINEPINTILNDIEDYDKVIMHTRLVLNAIYIISYNLLYFMLYDFENTQHSILISIYK